MVARKVVLKLVVSRKLNSKIEVSMYLPKITFLINLENLKNENIKINTWRSAQHQAFVV